MGECGNAIGATLASDENIQAEIAFLVEAVCPDSPDADACGPRMTEFWGAVDLCSGQSTPPTSVMTGRTVLPRISCQRRLFLPVSLVCPESMVLLMLWSGRTLWSRWWTGSPGCAVSGTHHWRSVRREWPGPCLASSQLSVDMTDSGSMISVEPGELARTLETEIKDHR